VQGSVSKVPPEPLSWSVQSAPAAIAYEYEIVPVKKPAPRSSWRLSERSRVQGPSEASVPSTLPATLSSMLAWESELTGPER
jgi:hypothetical protein